jgi:DNA end-binding protein Ku
MPGKCGLSATVVAYLHALFAGFPPISPAARRRNASRRTPAGAILCAPCLTARTRGIVPMARSIASLTLSFGLVNIPVKLYSATESSATIKFNLLAKDGARLKQQYVSDRDGKLVERADMVKGYEFEKDRFVVFTPDELKAVEESASHEIEIVAFVPGSSIDPLYYDKAYLLAPDKRGAKSYALLKEAMHSSSRCALARWRWKGKQYVVQVRPADDGLVLQQLLYADEVRSFAELNIEESGVSDAELKLALQLIEQIAQDAFDAQQFKDEERARMLAAIDRKIAGEQVVASAATEPAQGAQVIDLMEALRASLGKGAGGGAGAAAAPAATADAAAERKGVKRAAAKAQPDAAAEPEAAPARARARK